MVLETFNYTALTFHSYQTAATTTLQTIGQLCNDADFRSMRRGSSVQLVLSRAVPRWMGLGGARSDATSHLVVKKGMWYNHNTASPSQVGLATSR
jgi:hypothetical protein